MTKMTFMSDTRQLEIVSAVKIAADLVEAGKTPTEAIIKAAGDIKANEHVLQRMVEAYNTAATLAHLKTAEEKAASFPLADYDAAKKALFPEGKEALVAMQKVAKTTALEIPDLRMEKVAFWADLGSKYEIKGGEHKGKKGVLVASESTSITEESLDGKTKVRKNTDECTCTLKLTDGTEVQVTKPEEDLRRDYDSDGVSCPAPCEAKAASEKKASDLCCSNFYGSVGDRYKVVKGEYKDKKGTLKSYKSTRKETKKLDGNTKTTSESSEHEITLDLDGGASWTCKDPSEITRYYEEEKKASVNYHVEQSTELLLTPGTPIPRDFDSLQAAALKKCGHWQKVAQEARLEQEEHKTLALDAMHKIASVFRMARRPDWTQFEGEVLAVHGADAKVYLDSIYDTGSLGSVKCARAKEALQVSYIDTDTELHKLFEVFKIASEISNERKAEKIAAEAQYTADRAEILKLGAFSGNVADFAALGDFTKKFMGGMDAQDPPKPPGRTELNPNVGLEAELQKARLQAIIRDMMTEDEVIAQHAGEQPQRVMQAIEEVSSLNPRILEMPSVLQAGVRKHLEMGQMDPFEMKAYQVLGNPSATAQQKGQ